MVNYKYLLFVFCCLFIIGVLSQCSAPLFTVSSIGNISRPPKESIQEYEELKILKTSVLLEVTLKDNSIIYGYFNGLEHFNIEDYNDNYQIYINVNPD